MVPAGKILTVYTAGVASVDRVQNLPDAGYASDRVVNTAITYSKRGLDFVVVINAIEGNAEYTVALPYVAAGDIRFRRAQSGAIDALIDPSSGEAVPIGGGDTDVGWDDIDDKPGSFPPSSHNHAIGDVIGLQGALDGKQAAGNYAADVHTHAIGDVSGLQAALDGKQPAGSYATESALSDLEARVTALENPEG